MTGSRWLRYLNCLPLLVLLPCSVVRGGSETTSVDYYNAIVNVTAQEPGNKPVLDGGRYGLDSPVTEAKGIIVTPVNLQGGTADHSSDRTSVPVQTWATPHHIDLYLPRWMLHLSPGASALKTKRSNIADHKNMNLLLWEDAGTC
ncbi:hypothetical protein AB205_0165310 [Aquarana catesbeiana]|uniref:Uncharacterized protein n=1 Tax=Aquarana catesbeiana TaxID=8400 RepID=A0A2G9RJJ9_AQUCT|nr:hypothetical protein AB205_0165310 [Aquarana catesbeiana]